MNLHVVDSQVKLYGRTRKAAENAIRICSDEGVLKEYLDGRKKEVIDVMITLFSQEYAVDAYARERAEEAEKKGREEGKLLGREEGRIQATIEVCQEEGYSREETAARISRKYDLNAETVKAYLDSYWKEAE